MSGTLRATGGKPCTNFDLARGVVNQLSRSFATPVNTTTSPRVMNTMHRPPDSGLMKSEPRRLFTTITRLRLSEHVAEMRCDTCRISGVYKTVSIAFAAGWRLTESGLFCSRECFIVGAGK